jgi:hypothetical protein
LVLSDRGWRKQKKLPTKPSRPSIPERDILIGSFACGARHWTPMGLIGPRSEVQELCRSSSD